jgi:hypothetical protein
LADQATATFPLAAKMFTVFTATWPKYSEAGESSTTTSALFGHPDGSSVTIDV